MSKIFYVIIPILLISTSLARTQLKYPYIATEERTKLIKSQYSNIKIGNNTQEVLSILPNPDEIHDLAESKIYKPNIIGSTYWYIIQRKVESGSADERDEKLVRVSFDLNGKVTQIDKWGC